MNQAVDYQMEKSTAQPLFHTALQGYRKEDVHEYIRTLNVSMQEAQEHMNLVQRELQNQKTQCETLEKECAQLRADLQCAVLAKKQAENTREEEIQKRISAEEQLEKEITALRVLRLEKEKLSTQYRQQMEKQLELEQMAADSAAEKKQLQNDIQALRQDLDAAIHYADKAAEYDALCQNVGEILTHAHAMAEQVTEEADLHAAKSKEESDQILSQAKQTAENIIADATQRAEEILTEAKEQADTTIQQSKDQIRKDMEACKASIEALQSDAREVYTVFLESSAERFRNMFHDLSGQAQQLTSQLQFRKNAGNEAEDHIDFAPLPNRHLETTSED